MNRYSDMSLWELQHHLKLIIEEIHRRQLGDIERLGLMIAKYANRTDTESGSTDRRNEI